MKTTILLISFFLLFNMSAMAQQHEGNEGSLPVRISKINIAKPDAATVLLQWEVICRLPFARFQVQRSVDGQRFETIHAFQADRVRCQDPFDFYDRNISRPYYYRLLVGDLDGQFSNEKILFSGGVAIEDQVSVINPVIGDIIWIKLNFNRFEKVTLRLIGINGVRLSEESLRISPGQHLVSLKSTIPLSKGRYVVQVSTETSKQVIQVVRLE
jgi:hypothetical protein